jgi:hypothetical protein
MARAQHDAQIMKWATELLDCSCTGVSANSPQIEAFRIERHPFTDSIAVTALSTANITRPVLGPVL